MRRAQVIMVMMIAAFGCGISGDRDLSTVDAFQHEAALVFTAAEIADQRANIDDILKTASSCLQEDLTRQRDFYAQHGISAFYGDRSSFSRLSTAQKKAELVRLGKSPSLLSEMRPTSCVGLTLKCLGLGFSQADQGQTWAKVKAFTIANGVDGTAMQAALQKLGWKIYYWNPNPSRNSAWDQAEKRDNPSDSLHFWGYHAERYQTVVGPNHKYFYNKVDNWTSLVGFDRTPPDGFLKVPFYVGTAHTGYHVFPGSFGRVIEGHSTRLITDANTLESSEFNPLESGGGPRGQYRTGLIAVPPGYDF